MGACVLMSCQEQQELSQQLHESQQKLLKVQEELQESCSQREALSRELDAAERHAKHTVSLNTLKAKMCRDSEKRQQVTEVVSCQEAQLHRAEEELALKEARRLQEEARLQSTLSALEQELEQEKEQHGLEVQ